MPTTTASKKMQSLQHSKDKKAFDDMEQILAKLGKARTRLALEQRLVFDAAAAATGAEVAADIVAQEQAETAANLLSESAEGSILSDSVQTENLDSITDPSDPFSADLNALDVRNSTSTTQDDTGSQNDLSQTLADSLDQADAVSLSVEPTEVLFIDGGISNVQDLLSAVPANVEVFILDPSLDGVTQIADTLEGRNDIDAIHIISHGNSAQLNLGSTVLTSDSIQGNYADDLAQIGSTLSDHGDILIYGCNFGQGEDGAQAVNLLAQATGADIAASDDITGSAELGGDWDLEVETGQVEADVIEAREWDGALAALEISIPANAPVVQGVNADGQATYTINNAGIVGGQDIDIRATVVSATPGASISIYPSTGPINYGGDDILLVMNAEGDVEVRWDIFQSGTNQTVYAFGDPNFSIADLDGNAPGDPIETVSPSLNGITGYTLENNTTLEANITAGNVSVSGSASRNGESDSMVTFHWRDVSSWSVIYSATQGGRHYLHDGNGEFTFVDSQTVYMLGVDLDSDDSTTPNTEYAGTFVENGGAVSIVDSDFAITQHQILGSNLGGGSAVLTNMQADDQILINGTVVTNGDSGTLNGLAYTVTENNGSLTVEFIGDASIATYEAVFQNITFNNSSENPIAIDRQIAISVINTTYGTTSNAALAIIAITPVNDTPVAKNDGLITVLEDTPVSGTVLSNDSDIDGDTLTVSEFTVDALPAITFQANSTATIPDVGTLQINTDGTYTFTPALNYTGALPTATYTLSDGHGGTDTATLSFADIVNINDAPVAVNDGPLTIAPNAMLVLEVLPNDSDPDGDTLTVTHIIDPANPNAPLPITQNNPVTLTSGTQIALLADGRLDITAASNMAATEVFDYSISDGNGGTDTATVTLNRDNDGDGVADLIDLDDDNDGILDTDERGLSSIGDLFSLSGNATVISDNEIQLTAAAGNQVGVINSTSLVDFTNDFSLQFDMNFGTKDAYGADGIAIVFHNDPRGINASGLAGIGIGASGIQNGLVLEVDTFNNGAGVGDIASDHSSIWESDNQSNVLSSAVDLGNVEDGQWHPVEVTWDAATQTLSYTVDGITAGSISGDLANDYFAGETSVHLGYTASTGGYNNDQRIRFPDLTSQPFVRDTDGDGISDELDLDSDNDGISDLIESGQNAAIVDTNNDGIHDGAVDANGVPIAATGGVTPIDSDNDGIANMLDLDSDNDGIADAVEARPTAGYSSSTHVDNLTNNGVNDDGLYVPVDTDGDGTADYLDLDSDNDVGSINGGTDAQESGLNAGADLNGDGIGDGVGASYADPDGIVNNPSTDLYNQTGTTDEVGYREDNTRPETSGILDQSNLDNALTSLDISGSFTDVDTTDVLTYSATGLPTGLSIDPKSGIISGTIDHSASVTGTFPVTVTADDGNGGQVSTSFDWVIVNPAPTAENDSDSTAEDTAFSATVVGNDIDPDGDTLTYSLISGVSHGTLDLNANGTYSYTPEANFNGNDSFSYQIDDGEGGIATATVTITVIPVNDAPETTGILDQANNDAQTITPLHISSSFTDIEADTLSFSATGLPTGLSIDPKSGIISGTIDHSASVTGTFPVTVTADDGHGGQVSTSFIWAIANPAPIAINDAETIDEDTALTATVASNDQDPDGDTVTFSLIDNVAHGSLSFNPDGSYSYNPDLNFNGEDRFIYQVADGEGGIATATVIITVTPVNDAPIAVNDTVTTDENTATSGDITPMTAGQDSDVDGDVLTIMEVNGLNFTAGDPITLPSGAILTMAEDGSYSYNPNGQFESLADGQSDTDYFTYRISDGAGGIDTAVVSITITGVNDNPDAVDDVNATNEDTAVSGDLTPFNVIGQDSDIEPLDILSVSAINGDPAAIGSQIILPSGALLTVHPDGSYDYSPHSGFNSLAQGEQVTDSFIYTLVDGHGGSDTATVNIDITGVNDTPETSGIAGQSSNDADAIRPLDISGSFTDVDGDFLTFNATNLPTGLSIDPKSGVISGIIDPSASVTAPFAVVITADDGHGAQVSTSFTWEITNPAPIAGNDSETTDEDTAFNSTVASNDSDPDGDALNYSVVNTAAHGTLTFNADGSYSYNPDLNFNGEDRFTYLVDDGEGGTATATVIITVTSVNDAPETSGIAAQSSNDADAITSFDISGSFTDVDHDDLSFSAVNLPTGLSIDPKSGVISGIIDPSASLTAPFVVFIKVDDGQGGQLATSFTWEIANPAPTAGNDAETIDEDTALNTTVTSNDNDPDGDHLTYSVVENVAHGTLTFNPDGSYSYNPTLNFNGEDRFTYLVDDGEGGTATATVIITVTPVNDTPETSGIAAQSSNDADTIRPLDISSSFTDVDGDTLSFTAMGLPTGLAIDPTTGVISGTIDPSASVKAPFVVVVSADDGQGGIVSTGFTWEVANPGPTAGDDSETTDEDTAFNSTVASNDNDPDGDALTYSVVNTTAHGTLTFNTDGSYSYNPDLNFNGEDRFTYLVDDGEGGTATATVIISITPVNDPPETSGITAQSSNDADAIRPFDISSSFTDVDGDVLSFTATNLPTGLSIDPKSGVISGTIDPSASMNAPFAVVVTADDGQGGQVSTSFTWEVANPAPIAGNDSETTDEDTAFNSTVASNDSDPDGDALTYSVVNNVAHGTLTFNPDGSYNYSPDADFNGEDRFSYLVDDGEGGTATATVIISVTPVNDAPVAIDDSFTTTEDDAISGDITPQSLLGNTSQDYDVDGDTISITHINGLTSSVGQAVTLPSGALLSVNVDGSYDYNPNGSFNGLAAGQSATDSFTYTITDGHGTVDTATVTFNILGTNDNPIAVDDHNQTDQNSSVFGNLTPNIAGQDSDADITDVLSVVNINNLNQSVGQQITLPSGALLTVNADGSYFYQPNHAFDSLAQGESGQDSFSYTLSDGQGGSDIATITIDITGINDAPQTSGILDQSGNDADQITPLDISSSFSDIDGDVLTFSATNLPTGLVIDPATGIISGTIDPAASVNGPFAVVVTANDPQGAQVSTSFTWEITNPAPIAANDAQAIEEDTAFNGTVASNDIDPDGDKLTYSVVDDVTQGVLSFNPDGSYHYDPNGAFDNLATGETATDSFTYLIDDGQGGTDTATATFTIIGANDAPLIVIGNALTNLTGEDSQEISPQDLSVTFSDPDQTDVLTYTATGLPTGLTLDPQTGILSGIIDPDASQGGSNGVYTIVITATDPHDATVTDQFDWTVTNPAPIAADDHFTLAENAETTELGNAITQDTGAGTDVDPDGDALTIIPQNNIAGSAGGIFDINEEGVITFNPNGAFDDLAVGETRDSVMTYTLSDGQGGTDTAQISVSITGTNNTPILVVDAQLSSQTSNDGQPIEDIYIARSFQDLDQSDVFTFTATGLPEGIRLDPQTGILSGTINSDASQGGDDGVYNIVITATDPHGASVSDQFDWTIKNPAPIAVNDAIVIAEGENFSGNVITNSLTPDYDFDGDHLIISAVNGQPRFVGVALSGSTGGIFTLNEDGSYVFNAAQDFDHLAAGQTEVSTLEYTLSDGQGGTSTAVISATITGVNSPVTLVDPHNPNQEISDPNHIIPAQEMNDGETPSPLDIGIYFADTDQNTALTFTAENLPEGLVLNPNSGEITGTVASSASVQGPYNVIITATDDHGQQVSTTLVYNIENTAPITEADQFTIIEDNTFAGDVSINDSDADGDVLNFDIYLAPDHGQLSMQNDGRFIYTPDQDYYGSDSFTYSVTDSDGITRIQIVDLTILPVNDRPVVVTQLEDQDHSEADDIRIDVSSNFSDLDSEHITYTEVGLPDGLLLNYNTGVISGVLSTQAGRDGIVNVEITAHDNQGGTVSSNFIWSITPLAALLETTDTAIEQSSREHTEEASERVTIGGASQEHAADGIIVSTINGLKSLAGTVYQGFGQSDINSEQTPQAVGQMVERIADITGTSTDSWDRVGLSGFSIKMDAATTNTLDKDSLGTNGHLTVETLVRKSTIYIEIKDDLQFKDDRNVQSYRVTMANGEPLPSWLKLSDKNMLIGERPAHSETVELHITAQMNDGSKISKAIVIQTKNGSISALKP